MSKRKREDIWTFIKKRGLVAPGYKYLGPFNSLDKGQPVNKTDAAAYKHDKRYGELQAAGINPYVTYNDADEEFMSDVGDDFGGRIGKAVFAGKRKLAEYNLISSFITPEKKQKPLHSSISPAGDIPKRIDVKTPGDTMNKAPAQGSGNEAGLRATGRMQRSRRWIKRYRPTDRTKRHRLEDDQPKEEEVTSYTRRKA